MISYQGAFEPAKICAKGRLPGSPTTEPSLIQLNLIRNKPPALLGDSYKFDRVQRSFCINLQYKEICMRDYQSLRDCLDKKLHIYYISIFLKGDRCIQAI